MVVDSEIHGRLSTMQEEFIKFVTDKSSSGQKTPLRLWHDIPLEFLCDGSESIVPNVNWYYCKPVFVFAPHLTWPKLKLCCPECDQATISPKGWQSNPRGRYVHDIESSFYLVQYVYQCKNKECIKNIESKAEYARILGNELLPKLPEWVKAHWPIGVMNDRIAFSASFMTYLTTAITTGSLLFNNNYYHTNFHYFNVVGASIEGAIKMSGTLRATRYLKKRFMYSSAKFAYEESSKAGQHMVSSIGVDVLPEIRELPGFSTIDYEHGYNELLHVPFQTATETFVQYIEDRHLLIRKINEHIPISHAVSIDTTFNIRKRTKSKRSNTLQPSKENGMSFCLDCGSGMVINRMKVINDDHTRLRVQLDDLKKRANAQGVIIRTIISDDCCAMRPMINSIFNEKIEGTNTFATSSSGDAKHILNRALECVSKKHRLYSEFSKSYHACVVTGGTEPVLSRNGNWYKVPVKLDSGEQMWKRFEDLIEKYKVLETANLVSEGPLFLKDFDDTHKRQKYHFENCLFDPVDDEGKWYYESNQDGVFHLYRGTNRNEALHRTCNNIYPVQCGEILGDAMIEAHLLGYNFSRGKLPSDFGGVDPAVFRVGNLDYFDDILRVEGHGNSSSSSRCSSTQFASYNDMSLAIATDKRRFRF
jgi:hypothetical protein